MIVMKFGGTSVESATAIQRVVYTYVELKKGWARVSEEGRP